MTPALTLATLTLLLLSAACQHAPPQPVRGTMEIVDTPALGRPRNPQPGKPSDQTDIVTAAVITERNAAQPVLPPDVAAMLSLPCTLIVTVSFDATGTVTDVSPSIRGVFLPREAVQPVLAAVRAAVMTWHITPPRVIHYGRSKTGERLYLGSEPRDGSLDLKFDFDAAPPPSPRTARSAGG